MRRKHACVILDTSAILRGSVLNSDQSTPIYTTSSTIGEVKNKKKSFEVDTLLQIGRLKVLDADQRSKNLARKLSRMSGDIRQLSNVDIDLIALAIFLRDKGELPLLLTNDYAIQNVLTMAKIDYRAVGQMNIRKTIIWRYHCPICKRTYGAGDICPLCGTRLKKRTTKSTTLSKI